MGEKKIKQTESCGTGKVKLRDVRLRKLLVTGFQSVEAARLEPRNRASPEGRQGGSDSRNWRQARVFAGSEGEGRPHRGGRRARARRRTG
jgi:hypothetical protein